MCFTPAISLSIFLIEWILGFIVLFRRSNAGKWKKVYDLSAGLLFLLGFYQFTQFMFCTSGNYSLWGTIGFLAYNFLPAMGLHWAHLLVGKKAKLGYIYCIPVLYSFIALFTPNFIDVAGCSTYFIQASHSWSAPFISWIYELYYFGFIVYTAYLMFMASKEKKKDWKIVRIGFLGILAFTVPTFILAEIFPSLEVMFPSVLCEFALLFAIFLFYMIHLIEKSQKHR